MLTVALPQILSLNANQILEFNKIR